MSKVRYTAGLLFVAGLVLSGCEQEPEMAPQENEENENANANTGAETGIGLTKQVRVENGDMEDAESVFADRSPAGAGETVLTPVTNLLPGAAYVRADIRNPLRGQPEAVSAGQRHFAAFNCAGCHAPLAGGGMGPPLSDSIWIYGNEPAQIYLSILQGRPEGMPAWGAMLPERAIWELVSYIQTLPDIENAAERRDFPRRPPTSAN